MTEPVNPNAADDPVLDAAAAAIVSLLHRPLSAQEEAGLAQALATTPALHAEVAVADLLLQARAERQIADGADAAWAHLQRLLQQRTAGLWVPPQGAARWGAFFARWPRLTAGVILALALAVLGLSAALVHVLGSGRLPGP